MTSMLDSKICESLDEYIYAFARIVRKTYALNMVSSFTFDFLSGLMINCKEEIVVHLEVPVILFSIKGIPFVAYGPKYSNGCNSVYVLVGAEGDCVAVCGRDLRYRYQSANLMRFLVKNIDILNHKEDSCFDNIKEFTISDTKELTIPFSKMNELKF